MVSSKRALTILLSATLSYLAFLECGHALLNSPTTTITTTNKNKVKINGRIHRGSASRPIKGSLPFGVVRRPNSSVLWATDDDDASRKQRKKKATSSAKKRNKKKKSSSTAKQKRKDPSSSSSASDSNDERIKKKAEVMKQIREKLEEKKGQDGDTDETSSGGLLGKLNPFQAGQNLRQSIGRQITSLGGVGAGLSQETKQKYFLDDRLLERGGSGILTERNPYLERLERDDFVPEVLVIGATGEVGRLVVRRLLLEGRFRVRVLVRDLYSQTLNLLGTGVTYCQGELGDMESLEYALTDVDKIVFCAGAPRPDENGFQERFFNYMKENLLSDGDESNNNNDEDKKKDSESILQNIQDVGSENQTVANEYEWERLNSVLEVRANLAEQVDCIGMQNLVRAYQNVRHADYGTSQAAKRSIFKFSGRVGDFDLFALDEETEALAAAGGNDDDYDEEGDPVDESSWLDYNDDEEREYDDDDEGDDEGYYDELYNIESRKDASVKTQIQWIRNEFGNGVFVGKVPKEIGSGVGGEAAVVSSRLRSREFPEKGIDLSENFAGFIVRLCGDGGNYEAFIRTASFEKDGIEYVCKFSTSTKPTSADNKSRNKFTTVRMAFDDFEPVRRNRINDGDDDEQVSIQPFKGDDVQYIGFRYRGGDNKERAKWQQGENSNFYLAISYVKVYRLQPEPEFIYLSDARIPPNIRNGMVRHDRRELLQEAPAAGSQAESSGVENDDNAVQIFDEKTLADIAKLERSSEETYFKYRGEEMLKSSGLR